jgi:hypothetical protein
MNLRTDAALSRDELAVASEIFNAARANAPAPLAPKPAFVAPLDFDALAIFHTNEMQRLAAVGKAKDIIWNYDASLLTAEDRWTRLPAASRRILANYQSAGGGSFVPKMS